MRLPQHEKELNYKKGASSAENQKTAEPASFVKIVEEKVKKSDCFMQSYALK